jgi:hypothetical protein
MHFNQLVLLFSSVVLLCASVQAEVLVPDPSFCEGANIQYKLYCLEQLNLDDGWNVDYVVKRQALHYCKTEAKITEPFRCKNEVKAWFYSNSETPYEFGHGTDMRINVKQGYCPDGLCKRTTGWGLRYQLSTLRIR